MAENNGADFNNEQSEQNNRNAAYTQAEDYNYGGTQQTEYNYGYQNTYQNTQVNGQNRQDYYRSQGEQLSEIVGELVQAAGTQFGEIVKTVSVNLGNSAKEVSKQWQQNEAARRAQQQASQPNTAASVNNVNYRYSAPHAKFGNANYKSENIKGALMLGFGWIFGLMFGISTLVMLILLFALRFSVFGILAASFMLATAVFIALINGGAKKVGRTRRFKKYMGFIGDNKAFEIKRLAKLAGQTEKFVKRDIKNMIEKGLFDEAYLNSDETCLFMDKKTYSDYLDALNKKYEKQVKMQENPAAQNAIEEGRKFVEEMAQIRGRLNDKEICEKIERLEHTVTKIFDYVQEHPEKEAEIHKFMRYYLPTTLRLLRTYDEMKAQNISGETINNAMADIKKALDTIDTAFENLLDGLFEADALNIAAEINVMNTMLTQEGLTDSPINRTEQGE